MKFPTCRPYLALRVMTLWLMSATSCLAGPLPLPCPTLLPKLMPLLQCLNTEFLITNVVLSAPPLCPATMQSPMLNGIGLDPPSLEPGGLPPRTLVPSATT